MTVHFYTCKVFIVIFKHSYIPGAQISLNAKGSTLKNLEDFPFKIQK
jgi:hypothetical protein